MKRFESILEQEGEVTARDLAIAFAAGEKCSFTRHSCSTDILRCFSLNRLALPLLSRIVFAIDCTHYPITFVYLSHRVP